MRKPYWLWDLLLDNSQRYQLLAIHQYGWGLSKAIGLAKEYTNRANLTFPLRRPVTAEDERLLSMIGGSARATSKLGWRRFYLVVGTCEAKLSEARVDYVQACFTTLKAVEGFRGEKPSIVVAGFARGVDNHIFKPIDWADDLFGVHDDN